MKCSSRHSYHSILPYQNLTSAYSHPRKPYVASKMVVHNSDADAGCLRGMYSKFTYEHAPNSTNEHQPMMEPAEMFLKHYRRLIFKTPNSLDSIFQLGLLGSESTAPISITPTFSQHQVESLVLLAHLPSLQGVHSQQLKRTPPSPQRQKHTKYILHPLTLSALGNVYALFLGESGLYRKVALIDLGAEPTEMGCSFHSRFRL